MQADQPPPSGMQAGRPPADNMAPGMAPGMAPSGPSRREVCRETSRRQGLRGPEAQNQTALCMQEARTACLRQAITAQVPRPDQRAYVQNCIGG
jgi:hypothetical protein